MHEITLRRADHNRTCILDGIRLKNGAKGHRPGSDENRPQSSKESARVGIWSAGRRNASRRPRRPQKRQK